jgi:hypothetical protein
MARPMFDSTGETPSNLDDEASSVFVELESHEIIEVRLSASVMRERSREPIAFQTGDQNDPSKQHFFGACVSGYRFRSGSGPRCWKYRLTNDSIEFVMFGRFCVWRYSFEDITDIKPVHFVRLFTTPALSLVNRPFFARCVQVRLRRGVFRAVVMTPNQPDDLIKIVRQKMGISPGPSERSPD